MKRTEAAASNGSTPKYVDVLAEFNRRTTRASVASAPPLVVYVVDSTGFLALFRPRDIAYVDGRTTLVNGMSIRTPSRSVDFVAPAVVNEPAPLTRGRLLGVEEVSS